MVTRGPSPRSFRLEGNTYTPSGFRGWARFCCSCISVSSCSAGAASGVVVWMHLRGALQSVGGPGAVQYLPQALSLAVVLEFAPIAAGLIVAGRSGASL